MPGLDLRPTADRLRETLFNILTSGSPDVLAGSVWLDLYAGTGAVGIEALSRGAKTVYFVEASAKAAELIRKNLKMLGTTLGAQVMVQDVGRALGGVSEPVDYIFLDPPYRLEAEYARTLESLATLPSLSERTIVVAEHHKKFDPGEGFGDLHRYRKVVQGDAALSFYRRIGA